MNASGVMPSVAAACSADIPPRLWEHTAEIIRSSVRGVVFIALRGDENVANKNKLNE
jgi:hypothetical protein